MIKIGIGADIVPTKSNYSLFIEGNKEELLGKKLCEILSSCDYTILNLETPLTNTYTPINKCGPALFTPEETILGISRINPHFFNLANNHILDQGVQGLKKTVELLDKYDINYAGVGKNINDIKKYSIIQIKNKYIGIYCCAENEFSIATKSFAGANPYDPLESFDDVSKLKENVDFLIVLYHGGIEEYRYPSPNMQKIFRKFADKGADIVIGQHSHCIGCKETYKNSTLIYGQGNFLFDAADIEPWKTSLFLEIYLNDNSYEINYIPLAKQSNRVRVAENNESKDILSQFNMRSENIKREHFIENSFVNLCKYKSKPYIRVLSGNKNILKKVFIKLFNPPITFFYKLANKLMVYNYLNCESHYEIMKAILKGTIENDKDIIE